MNRELRNLKRLVQLHLGVTEVDESDRLIEDLEAESVDIVNMIVDIEVVFEVTIDEADLEQVSTVRELWEAVQRAYGGA